MPTPERNNPVLQVIEAASTQTALAAKLGVSQQAVSSWLRQGWVPVKRARRIEKLYGIPRVSIINPELRALVETR